MADSALGYYNPNIRKQGEKTRRLAAERSAEKVASQDPRTYGFVSGLMGDDYGSSPISVLDPKRAKSQTAQDVGMAIGTASEVIPGVAALRRPAVSASKAVGKSALKAVNDAHLYGEGFLAPITPQAKSIIRTEKGGNWWPNNIESQVTNDLKKPGGGINAKAKSALNDWIDKKLGKYIQNEMGSPYDPIMKRIDSGKPYPVPIDQYVDESILETLTGEGTKASKTDLGKLWEGLVESFMPPAVTAEKTHPFFSQGNEEWLKTLPKDAKIHNISPNNPAYDGSIDRVLGFDHIVDELYNATRKNSGLPRDLIYTPEQLSKVTVDQAVERVVKINEWRAAQKVEANKAKAVNAATELFKEYPENNPKGLRWVELKPTGSGATYKDLEEALKYEGDVMGHCVGGYCDDVYDGKQRIFSLRDKTGQPHVTIEMKPAGSEKIKDIRSGNAKNWEILQVKGKGNGKPSAEYTPYVQDFVKETNAKIIGDLHNTDLQPIEWAGADPRMIEAAKQKFGNYAPPKEFTDFAEQWKPSPYTQEVLPAAETPSTDPFWFNAKTGAHAPMSPEDIHAQKIQDPTYASQLGVTPEQATAYPLAPEAEPLMTGRQTGNRLSLVGLGTPTDETLLATQKMLQEKQYQPEVLDFGGGERLWEGMTPEDLLKAKSLQDLEPYKKYKSGGQVSRYSRPVKLSRYSKQHRAASQR